MAPSDVHDRASFAAYVARLRAELDDPARRDGWENPDLARFLEAMRAWATDWRGPADPDPWRHAADLLAAARTYE